jgi:hypothetical protein
MRGQRKGENQWQLHGLTARSRAVRDISLCVRARQQHVQSRFSFEHFMRNTSANPHRPALQPLFPSLRSRHLRTEPQAAHRRVATRRHLRRVVRLPTLWLPMPTPCRCLESHKRTATMIEREKCKGPCFHSHTVNAQSVTGAQRESCGQDLAAA